MCIRRQVIGVEPQAYWFLCHSSPGKIQCNPKLCQNGGECHEKLNTYSCTCPKRFKGQHCELDAGINHFYICM